MGLAQPEILKAVACLGSWPQGSWALGAGLAREPQKQSRAWQPHPSWDLLCLVGWVLGTGSAIPSSYRERAGHSSP